MFITKIGAEKMAQFWKEQVLGDAVFDAGSDSRSMIMSEALAKSLANMIKPTITEEQAEGFRKDLLKSILHENVTRLTTNYSPCSIIKEAAKANNIPFDVFPWKSETYIGEDREIYAKVGYSGELVRI